MPGEFFIVVVEKEGEDHLDRSCGKWSIKQIQEREEYPTNNNKEKGSLDWSHLA
jgi:hypothetical protein